MQRAELYFNKYKVYESRDPVDWDSKHGLCFLLGAQLVEQAKITSSVDWKANLAAYLKEAALKQGKTPGGLLYYPGSSDENSLPTAMGITYIMTEYARLFPSDPLSKQLRQLADQQIDYVFGSNPRGMTYIVGITEKSPKNPQVRSYFYLDQHGTTRLRPSHLHSQQWLLAVMTLVILTIPQSTWLMYSTEAWWAVPQRTIRSKTSGRIINSQR